MEGNGKDPRSPRRDSEAMTSLEKLDYDEETTETGLDPVLNEAIASLRRVQADVKQRASDVTQLLEKKKLNLR